FVLSLCFSLSCYPDSLYLHSFPTRRSSDLIGFTLFSSSIDFYTEFCINFRRCTVFSRFFSNNIGPFTSHWNDLLENLFTLLVNQIGRAHVSTPVTFRFRMPSSA